mgnify:FL=1|jgi:hypothetical protein
MQYEDMLKILLYIEKELQIFSMCGIFCLAKTDFVISKFYSAVNTITFYNLYRSKHKQQKETL